MERRWRRWRLGLDAFKFKDSLASVPRQVRNLLLLPWFLSSFADLKLPCRGPRPVVFGGVFLVRHDRTACHLPRRHSLNEFDHVVSRLFHLVQMLYLKYMIKYPSTSICRTDSNINNTIIKTLRAQLFLRDTYYRTPYLAAAARSTRPGRTLRPSPLCRSGHSTRASLALRARADAAVHSDDSERGGACSVSRSEARPLQQQSVSHTPPSCQTVPGTSRTPKKITPSAVACGRAQVCNAQTDMTTTGGLGARSQDPAGGAGYPDNTRTED